MGNRPDLQNPTWGAAVAALEGLHSYARSGELQAPAHYRLAFRELGLAIGLHAVQRMSHPLVLGPGSLSPTARRQLKELSHYVPLASRIESFWRQPAQRRVAAALDALRAALEKA